MINWQVLQVFSMVAQQVIKYVTYILVLAIGQVLWICCCRELNGGGVNYEGGQLVGGLNFSR